MAVLIATELFTLYFAMTTLSAVRAFVGGEGLWSKAQKTGLFNLQKYATTRDEKYYASFRSQLEIPMGDHAARIELEKVIYDEKALHEGFLKGQNHPKDIPPMINLVRRFHKVPKLARAIEKWKIGDDLIFQMIRKAEELHELIQKNPKVSNSKIELLMQDIFQLDDQLTKAENQFSFALGEASRWLESMLMIILLMAVVTVESTGIFLTISFGRSLTRNLRQLNEVAKRVGQGDFSQQVHVESSDELGQLAESINSMTVNLRQQTNERQNAEHASETKNLFLANMSHEIRTPLSAILGFSEILADPDLSPSERSHYAAIIKRTGASLTSIINDILDVSKVEAERLEIELKSFSLGQLLQDLYAVLQLRCEEKGVNLQIEKVGEVSDTIQSDPARLRQILANIIGNSIKFTDRGDVKVFYEVTPPYLTFTVKDTGAGIRAEQISRLFKPFSQGDDSIRKKYGGTGLGLLISRRLAHLLGGDILLQHSRLGEGSTFCIRISYHPLTQGFSTPSKVVTKTASEEPQLSGKKILIVEDSLDNQLLAQLYLAKSGAEVEFANNGKEGLEKAMAKKFDVILMDMQMPVMDGYAATQELRKKDFLMPIIALTGFAMKEDREKCLQAGCNAYLSKPFDRKNLVECILANIFLKSESDSKIS